MSLFTSSNFAAATAQGTDWRDTAKAVLEKLEDVRTEDYAFNVGFLYISDHLAEDAESILNLFKSVLQIEEWTGCIGVGVCGCGEAYIDQPAISAMVGSLEDGQFCAFPSFSDDVGDVEDVLKPWRKAHQAMLVLAHGDPQMQNDLLMTLSKLEHITGGFITGGLSASRKGHLQFAGKAFSGGVSGMAFSSAVKVATTLSLGCSEIGGFHEVTKVDHDQVLELDHEKASDVFEDDLRRMAIKKIDRNPDEVLIDEENIPEEYQELFRGEIHAAIPVTGSDQRDYVLRKITDLDVESGALGISEALPVGSNLLFVKRDPDTIKSDLSAQLVALRKRVLKQDGAFEPKAAIYISCAARADVDALHAGRSELTLVRDIIGDVPLCGFYAGGEINNARLYSHSGILILFL